MSVLLLVPGTNTREQEICSITLLHAQFVGERLKGPSAVGSTVGPDRVKGDNFHFEFGAAPTLLTVLLHDV